MKTGRRSGVVCLLLAASLAGTAGPAAADWLVTREGARVETRGGWEVKGKLVVFRTPGGALSSLRLAEVDLEASRRATAEAGRARRPASEAPKRKAPVRVVTDKDVRHIEEAKGQGSAAEAPRLTVTGWERSQDPESGNTVITGTLRNASSAAVREISLEVRLLDGAGNAAVTGGAVLTATELGAGEQSGFRIELPGASFSAVEFEPRATFGPQDSESPSMSGGAGSR